MLTTTPIRRVISLPNLLRVIMNPSLDITPVAESEMMLGPVPE